MGKETDRTGRRSDRSVRKVAARELPNQLDAARLDLALRDLPKDAREALLEVTRGSQSNFDHMNSEYKRFTDHHNEHAADLSVIKDDLASMNRARALRSEFIDDSQNTWGGDAWWATGFGGTFLGDATFEDELYAFPFYVENGGTVDALSISVYDTTSAGDVTNRYIRGGIYAGDRDWNFPGSLIVEFGVTNTFNNGTGAYTIPGSDDHAPVLLDAGMWYWAAISLQGSGGNLADLLFSTHNNTGWSAESDPIRVGLQTFPQFDVESIEGWVALVAGTDWPYTGAFPEDWGPATDTSYVATGLVVDVRMV
jgi:hypothetical protein